MGSLPSRVVLSAVTVLILAGPSSVVAQPAPVAPAPSDAQAMASQMVDDGIAAQEAQDYDEAIELYTRAYNVLPHPLMLFDIAQAHRLAGRVEEAERYYERYLSADPEGEQAGTARALLEILHEAARTEPAPAAKVVLHIAPVIPGRTLRVVGLLSGAAGIACAGAAVAFGVRLESIEREQVIRMINGMQYDPEQVRAGKAAERNQFIAIGLSGTFLVGGAVLYWVGYRKSHAAQTTAWAPMIGSGVTGIAVTGTLP